MFEQSHLRGRGVPRPPSLQTELVRQRLLDGIAKRFDVPFTVLVAGPGFGKSVLLAQAIRANQADPRGIDAWLSCEPGDGDAARLADAITAALPVDPGARRGDPLARVLAALNSTAPIDACVVIDEIHEIPRRSPAAALLGELADHLPPHAHLIVAGRTSPIELGRQRRAGRVVVIDASHLAFTPTEVDALARLVGRDPGTVAGLDRLAGWPSLVRLALSAPAGAAPQFLWEEVVAGLSCDERRWLLALATLGWGTSADIATVAGSDRSTPLADDLAGLAAKVPLVSEDADGVFRVHGLWEEAVERIFPAAERRLPRRRALELFQRRDETLRAGWSAARWGETEGLLRAARALVRDTVGSLPVDTAARWLESAPEHARCAPDFRLLDLALRHSRRYDDVDLDAAVDAIADEFDGLRDRDGAAVALTLATMIGHMRGDLARVLTVGERARALPGADKEPLLRFLGGIVDAATSSLAGDPQAAVAAIELLSLDGVPVVFTDLVHRLHVNMLCLCGRAAEAVPIADRLLDSQSAYARTIPATIRWLAGDPAAYPGGRVDPDVPPGTNDRYRLYHASYAMAVAASYGDRDTVAAVRPVLHASTSLDVRDRVLFDVAIAIGHVADHDEAAAADAIRAHVDDHLDDRVAEGRLRRLLAVPYVCDERLRARWHGVDLGPSLERQRHVADVLLAARAGILADGDTLPPAAAVVTALPLVWSAELAARAVATGCTAGHTLARGLAELAPAALRAELGLATSSADDGVRDGARQLLDELPDAAGPVMRVGVLGTLIVENADSVERAVSLRRRRVRTLLELLVLLGPLRRDRIADLIWPDLDPDAAQANVRVTLSRLRGALAPTPDGRRRCAALRIDQDVVALTAECVDVDWWQFRDDVALADEAERVGDTATAIDALDRATGRWRGEPFADVDPVDDVAAALEEVHQLLVDTTLRLGEQLLVSGRFDEAAACAERAVRESPYTERAHRLAIAAQLQRRDRHAVAHAVAATRAMLAELGVDAEPPTCMLLRKAEARIGDVELASRRR